MAHFIVTEAIAGDGAAAEQRVWQAVRDAWRTREAVVYWRYPVFTAVMREPDILILDRTFGLVVIEVKALRDGQVRKVDGHIWTVDSHVTKTVQPYEQARRQVQALLTRLDIDPALERHIPARALVGLPLMSRAAWRTGGFAALPSAPPCLFGEDLGPAALLGAVQQAALVQPAPTMGESTWRTLLSALGSGGGLRTEAPPPEPGLAGQRAEVMRRARAHRHDFDHQQEAVARIIPPGPQRIRGIAGSGKTVLLAQKAAAMHLKHPEWRVAVVFFNRSLYGLMERQVNRWLQHFSGGQVALAGAQTLKVFHAWGSVKQDGFYRLLAREHGVRPRSAAEYQGDPTERLGQACRDLLLETEAAGGIRPLFDAILIDESQDLVIDTAAHRYRDRQPVFWLAFQALRPDPVTGQRRLIWAYDEAQSLNARAIPTARELFGAEYSRLVTGTHGGGAQRSEIMNRCYRTPGEILVAAHALGMGLLRDGGLLTGLTNRRGWEAIGYEVEGQLLSGRQVTLRRPTANSPHPLSGLWQGPLLHLGLHDSREAELNTLMAELQRNVNLDGLTPSRQVLVIVLGQGRRKTQLIHEICRRMTERQLDYYLPGQLRPNDNSATDWRLQDRNRFWWDGAITVTDIHRAKGHEADMVHVVGLDAIAAREDDIAARNQLFTAMTRTRGWLRISGAGCQDTALVDEFRRVLASRNTFTFTYRRPPQRVLDEDAEGPPSKKPAWLTDWV